MTQLVPAIKLAQMAQSLATRGIPFVRGGKSKDGMDAGGFIYYCLNQIGVHVPYMATNTLYRAIGASAIPIAQAKAEGKLVPGAILFHVGPSGGEPAHMRGDGRGDADYAAIALSEDRHAYPSQIRKKLDIWPTRFESGRVNMVVFHPALDYGFGTTQPPMQPPVNPHRPVLKYMVVIGDGKLNLRGSPSIKGTREAQIPEGTVIPVFSEKGDWVQSEYVENGILKQGWCKTEFLADHTSNA